VEQGNDVKKMNAERRHNLGHADYIRLLMDNQVKVVNYIQMLVQDYHDAEDIFQESAAIAWEKFDTYEPGTNFAAWMVAIARNRIMYYWEKRKRSVVHYSSDTLESIESHVLGKSSKDTLERLHIMKDCVEKLSSKDRELIQMRYASRTTVKSLAEQLERSIYGLYSSLSRIHVLLVDCVRRHTAVKERLQ
jgi:RNA polymerase sigma-70 factor (ECF subfamily)